MDRPRPTAPWEPAWSLHPSVLVGVALLALLYFWGVGPARRRYGLGPPVDAWRVVAFVAALAVLLVSLNGPIHDLSDYYLFWVHMGQHLLLTLVLPPLLLASMPPWLLEPLVRRPGVRRVARLLTHPVVAGAVFAVSLVVWHTVAAYDLMMREHGVHVATHLAFMATAVLFWWPVMSPVPSLPRLGPGMGMLYLFLAQIPMQILAAIITFADEVLYGWYATAPRTWGLTPLEDQQIGGLLMWIPGNLWIWGAMSVLFFRWAKEERDS
ncbi:MAG: cytochrome c oxidase assembly protein [Gemmatimonadales bacterium]